MITETQQKAGPKALIVPIFLLLVMWGVHWIELRTDWSPTRYGIHPLELDGLWGILLAPILHSPSDWGHIINNSPPFFVLCWVLYYFYYPIATRILLIIWLMTGICVWVSGLQYTNHIGMSGVIYGLAGFLFTSGVIRKDKNLLAISLLVVFEYGSMIWGILPLQERVSWESHLWGAVVGVAMAMFYKLDGPKRKKYQWEIEEELGLDQYEYEYWNPEAQPPPPPAPPASSQDDSPKVTVRYTLKKKNGTSDRE